MESTFQNILDDIKNSKKQWLFFQADSIKAEVKNTYKINNKSLLAVLLEHTGEIIIDHWIRLYGAGEVNFISRNSLSF